MISHDTIFQQALRCIPPAEKADSQMVTLIRGDLYFISSTMNSWFIIKGFMNTDISFRMTVKDLRTILALGPEVAIRRHEESGTRLIFTSGNSTMTCGVLSETELPVLRPPNPERFSPIPGIFKRAARFNSIVDENTRMSTISMEDDSVLYVLSTRRSICGICYTGDEDIISSNFTNNYEAVNTAANSDGKYYLDRDLLYLLIDPEEGRQIMSCMKVTAPLATQEARAILSRYAVGQAWKDMDGVRISLSTQKYFEFMTMAARLESDGDAKFVIADNQLTITVTDSFSRVYSSSFPCETEERISYFAFMIPASHLRVLASVDTVEKKAEAKIDMYVLLTHRKMIMTIPNPEADYFPYIIYQLRLPR